MNKIDWDNAPEGAEFYAFGSFRKDGYFFCEETGKWVKTDFTREYYEHFLDYCERPQVRQEPTKAELEAEKRTEYSKMLALKCAKKQNQNTQEPSNKYIRQIVGLDGKTCKIDVYRVLAAFEVDSHPVAHAIKKLLAPGKRHAKTREQDLKEAIASIEAELLMMEQSNE